MSFVSEIFIAGIFATIAMTFFSYVLSFFLKSNFKEPQIINLIIFKTLKNKSYVKRHDIYGWLIHFVVGILFVAVFKIIRLYFLVDLTYFTGFIYGFFGGILGVVIYALAFAVHPNPPVNNKILFYYQLVVGHIIFGLVMLFFLRHL